MGINKRATRRQASLLTTCRKEMLSSQASRALGMSLNYWATNPRLNRRQMAYLVTEITP